LTETSTSMKNELNIEYSTILKRKWLQESNLKEGKPYR